MKKKFICWAFSFSCIGMLLSCTSEMDEITNIQNVAATRSVSAISLTYPISSFAEECIFADDDLSELESMLSLMQDYDFMGHVYIPLFEYAKSNGNKVSNIGRDSNLSSQGGYNPKTKAIMFGIEASISNVFPEEFIHFSQDYYYPGGTTQYITKGKPNIEMEAKIIEDCAALYGGGCSYYGAGPTYAKQYEQWIWDFVFESTNNFPSMNDVLTHKESGIGYRDFVEDLKKKDASYNYESISSLNPILIDFIYNKL